MNKIKEYGGKVIIYEPRLLNCHSFHDDPVINNLQIFKDCTQIIIANRYDKSLDDVKEKVYTRDLFGRD